MGALCQCNEESVCDRSATLSGGLLPTAYPPTTPRVLDDSRRARARALARMAAALAAICAAVVVVTAAAADAAPASDAAPPLLPIEWQPGGGAAAARDAASLPWGGLATTPLGGARGNATAERALQAAALGVCADAAFAGRATLAPGWHHTCALSTAGRVSCWGWNDYGQTTVPAGVAGGAHVSVAAGLGHSCAVSAAGSVSCWGGTTGVRRAFLLPCQGPRSPCRQAGITRVPCLRGEGELLGT